MSVIGWWLMIIGSSITLVGVIGLATVIEEGPDDT